MPAALSVVRVPVSPIKTCPWLFAFMLVDCNCTGVLLDPIAPLRELNAIATPETVPAVVVIVDVPATPRVTL